LSILQERASDLQAQLDENRLKYAMDTTGPSVEEAMRKVGVPPRNARGSAARSYVP